MKLSAIALGAVAVAVVVLANCHGGSTVDSASTTHVTLESSPATPYVGDPVAFTVTAHNDQHAIKSVAVDYTDDGIVDETQTCDARAVSLTFNHTYSAAGTYDVRAVATDAIGEDASSSTQVSIVPPPPLVPITLTVDGTSPQDGRCFAFGPPVTCPNCAVLVGTSTAIPLSVSLGQHYRGSKISVDQAFNQWPVVFGDALYQCAFHMALIAGDPGHEHAMGSGTCTTTSLTRPAALDCNIALAGTVP